jgi:hypothetical protein
VAQEGPLDFSWAGAHATLKKKKARAAVNNGWNSRRKRLIALNHWQEE